MNPLPWRLLVGSVMAWSATAHAAGPYRLDDSSSTVEQPEMVMQWSPLRAGTSIGAMETRLWVNVRIDLHNWVGRHGRVYMVLPPDESPPLELTWTTQGRMLAGRLVSGERALVYAGVIDRPQLQDRLSVKVLAQANWVGKLRRITTYFEFEPN